MPDGPSGGSEELWSDLLGDQAALRASLDQLDAAVRSIGLSVIVLGAAGVALAVAVFLMIKGEIDG